MSRSWKSRKERNHFRLKNTKWTWPKNAVLCSELYSLAIKDIIGKTSNLNKIWILDINDVSMLIFWFDCYIRMVFAFLEIHMEIFWNHVSDLHIKGSGKKVFVVYLKLFCRFEIVSNFFLNVWVLKPSELKFMTLTAHDNNST